MLMHPRLSERVTGLAINVHRALGPGLLESVYETCLAFELEQANIAFKRQVQIPVIRRGVRLETGFRADLLIAEELIVEIKAVDHLLPAHDAQTLTYRGMSTCQVALLFNFNALRLKDGLRRFVRNRQSGETLPV